MGFVKIGYSANVQTRLKDLQTASPFELRVIGTMAGTEEDERAIHQRFRHLHERGEWFRRDPELMQAIKEYCGEENSKVLDCWFDAA